jgi:hypothetical protein
VLACSRSGRYQFAARIVDDHVICLAGDERRAALEDSLKTVRHAGGQARRGAHSLFFGLEPNPAWEALHYLCGWIGHLKSMAGSRVIVTSPAV